ncbi:MAG: RimK family alpha-L-glutamate ligase [Chloroflexota bacterium]
MKIGILSRNSHLYSTRRLAQAAKLRGHSTTIVDTTTIPLEMGQVTRLGQKYAHLDAIIPRIGTSIAGYGIAVVRHFEALNITTTASSEGIHRASDKLLSLQLMNREGLPLPKTAVIHNHTTLPTAIRAVGGLPVVLKRSYGSQGQGVELVHDLKTAVHTFRQLHRAYDQVLIQEFIAEAEGKDLRLIMVNGRCVAAMQRSAPPDDFRANLHQGGTAVSVDPTPAMRDLARKVCQVHNIAVAGVDLVHSKRGPLLLEVNASPGLKGIEQASGVNVAKAIVEYLETAVPPQQKKRKKRKKKRA